MKRPYLFNNIANRNVLPEAVVSVFKEFAL